MTRRWMQGAVVVVMAGCASVVPKELITARNAYDAMNGGVARTAAPNQAERAKLALERAEGSQHDQGATRKTRQLALDAEQAALEAQAVCLRSTASSGARLTAALTAVPNTVMFDFDKSELLPAAKERLDELAQALVASSKENGEHRILVKGYADAKGEEDYNRALSRRRADAVRDYLSERGFDPSFVQVRAFGELYPAASNTTEEGRAENRRVEIVLGPKKND